jgi:hypothetical protein
MDVNEVIKKYLAGQALLKSLQASRVNPIPPRPPRECGPAPRGTTIIECGPDGRRKKVRRI